MTKETYNAKDYNAQLKLLNTPEQYKSRPKQIERKTHVPGQKAIIKMPILPRLIYKSIKA